MYSDFFTLIRHYFHQTPCLFSNPDWEKIYELAKNHHILPLIYEAARTLPEFQQASPSLQRNFQSQAIGLIVGQQTRTDFFLETYGHLTKKGLRPLILKGLICRLLYPQPDCRPSSDEDLWIDPKDFPLYDSILKTCGYHCVLEQVSPSMLKNAQTINYEHPLLTLELHINPFSTKSDTHKAMNRIFSQALSQAHTLHYNGQTLYTLSPTHHCLFLFVHLYKHFLSAGAGIRQLLDLCLFQQAYQEEIDQTVVDAGIRSLKLTTFYAALMKIGRDTLGFSSLPQKSSPDTRPLLLELVDAGCYGSHSDTRRYSSVFTQATLHPSAIKGPLHFLSILFLPFSSMCILFPQLSHRPWLLPFFWIKRWKRIGRQMLHGNIHLMQSYQTGKNRIRLFRLYKIRPIEKEDPSHRH